MRLICIFLLTLTLPLTVIAQKIVGANYCQIRCDLSQWLDGSIQLQLYPSLQGYNNITFKFPANSAVSELEIWDINGNTVPFDALANNGFSVLNADKIFKIQYNIAIATYPLKSKDPQNTFFIFDPTILIPDLGDASKSAYKISFTLHDFQTGTANVQSIIDGNLQHFLYTQKADLYNDLIFFSDKESATSRLKNKEIKLLCLSNQREQNAYRFSKSLNTFLKPYEQTMDNDTISRKLQYTIIYTPIKPQNNILKNTSYHTVYAFNQNFGDSVLSFLFEDIKQKFAKNIVRQYIQTSGTKNGASQTEHEWLYSGLNDYLETKLACQSGSMSKKDFERWLSETYTQMLLLYDTLSLTKLQQQNENNNRLIKSKGAIYALALDIEILTQSGNTWDLLKILKALSKRNRNEIIDDQEFFYEIIRVMGHATVADFLWRYIDGGDALPLNNYIEKLGYECAINKSNGVLGMASIQWQPIQYLQQEVFQIKKIESDYLSNMSGLKEGDIILSINKTPFNYNSFYSVLKYINGLKQGNKVKVQLVRKKNNINETIKIDVPLNYFKSQYDFELKTIKSKNDKIENEFFNKN